MLQAECCVTKNYNYFLLFDGSLPLFSSRSTSSMCTVIALCVLNATRKPTFSG